MVVCCLKCNIVFYTLNQIAPLRIQAKSDVISLLSSFRVLWFQFVDSVNNPYFLRKDGFCAVCIERRLSISFYPVFPSIPFLPDEDVSLSPPTGNRIFLIPHKTVGGIIDSQKESPAPVRQC